MVDVSTKEDTLRTAEARGRIHLSAAVLNAIQDGSTPKGDVLATARIAGIMAAKKTSELIPLCHPLALTNAAVDFEFQDGFIEITAKVSLKGKTGVEMEALTAVSVAALTLYDMVKGLDKAGTITDICLIHKTGGKSGTYNRKLK